MIVAVVSETLPGERRVAMVPGEAAKLTGAGVSVVVQSGAGRASGYADDDFSVVGATIATTAVETVADADVVAKVQAPTVEEAVMLPTGCTLVSFLSPAADLEAIRVLAERKVTSFSFELVPRISRAQGMDALSSQASVAGYRAALVAAVTVGRFFPMVMTAAGTVPPTQVLVLGAGVAGLQAIATARRLGAVVKAYDVRPEAAEEVRSLGATFLELGLEARAGTGGYAAEQSADFLDRQQQLVADTVAASDVVITTAAVPGRRAPLLVTTSMVERMRPGSVIVDVAAASGGNCELTRDGEVVRHHEVAVIGGGNLAAEVPTHASALLARNVANLLSLVIRDGELVVDFDDAVLDATCVTSSGVVRNQTARELLEAQ